MEENQSLSEIEYNPYNPLSDDKKNWIKRAKEFSEGNVLFAATLLKLWNNNIRTTACCNGHKEFEFKSYLSFMIDDYSAPLINNLCNNIKKFDDLIISFTYIYDRYGEMSIRMTKKTRDKVLFYIFSNIDKLSEEKVNNKFLYSKYFIDYARRVNLNFGYYFTNDEQFVGLTRPTTWPVFIDPPSLDDMLKTDNSFSLGSYSCNDESLEKLVGIINSNVDTRSKKH